MRNILIVLSLMAISGCSYFLVSEWDARYGTHDPARFDQPLPESDFSYQNDIQPILDQRCVVCHACYDAPCQLKLQSYDGLTRGANPIRVYNGKRILAEEPTRLNIDAHSNKAWRNKGFFPVLNERDNNAEANIAGSVMAQMLLQKQKQPLPEQAMLPGSFRLELNHPQECTSIENFEDYQTKYPLWGMPYALPALNSQEHTTLMNWLAEGSPHPATQDIPAAIQSQIKEWEQLLNQDGYKAQLISRYIYEHLFQGHLYFENDSNSPPMYFELIRSRSPAPAPIDVIATRFPFSDPKVNRVYYRLRPITESIVFKTHQPYVLNQARKQRWNELFFNNDFSVTSLPGYQLEVASNPFETFKQLPVESRYRFMLDEAQFIIMGFIKGPVCRGNLALNVINDHFWVTFVNPNYQSSQFDTEFLSEQTQILEMPASDNATAGVLNWMSYATKEQQYLEARARYLNEKVETQIEIGMNMLWDGDGGNNNATLTVYRHFDSASVVKGLHGGAPQTMWVIDYTLLERIHYLLVSGFDVFGNIGHQLNTRIYMDFLRMEGEFNFMMLLPRDYREAVHKQWYRGNVASLEKNIYDYHSIYSGETAIDYKTSQPLNEVYGLIQQYMAPVIDHSHDLDTGFADKKVVEQLNKLDSILGIAAAQMPQVSVMKLTNTNTKRVEYYSIISNTSYTNISHLYGEEDRHRPNEDTLTVAHGILGAHPNVFLNVTTDQLEQFVAAIDALRNPDDFKKLMDNYGIRRTAKHFWQFSDELHAWHRRERPIESGILDYNRLENK